jgi:mRNA interferase RelE/StbE
MASYRIQLKPAVQKDFRKIPTKTLQRILQAIEDLGSSPFPAQSIKLTNADRFYRLRAGDYRIVYEVETEIGVVTIHYVRHRREVYRSL